MNAKSRKTVIIICLIISCLWSVPFLLTMINSSFSRFVHKNILLGFLEDSYYNFYSLFIITSFCFINLLLIIKAFVKKELHNSNKWLNALYITVSVIAYIVHFLVFRYFLQGAFAG